MGFSHFRYARRVDGDVIKLVHNDDKELIRLDKGTANKIKLSGSGGTTNDYLLLYPNLVDTAPFISIKGDDNITLVLQAGKVVKIDGGGSISHYFDSAGVHFMLETTTPTARTNYGAIYTKTDNKLYFQDGAGTEHEVAFSP